jgi:uncharacterized membrane protein
MDHHTANLALASSFAAALSFLAIPASAQNTVEKCYGISLAGQNDCAAGAHDCKGHSKLNFDRESFKEVPKGTCTAMNVQGHKGRLNPAKS